MTVPNQALGDRMKYYEATHRRALDHDGFTIIRVDGRAFHTFTRGMDQPFDEEFADAMRATAATLCAEIQGAVMAYTQSDEISIVTHRRAPSETAFGGVETKILSLTASIATAAFNEQVRVKEQNGFITVPHARAQFDSRLFTLADDDGGRAEVANYLIWRQQDARRNAVNMAASSIRSHKQLHGVNTAAKLDMLDAAGIEVAPSYLRGTVIHRVKSVEAIAYTDKRSGETRTAEAERSRWVADTAPEFSSLIDHSGLHGLLDEVLPEPPTV